MLHLLEIWKGFSAMCLSIYVEDYGRMPASYIFYVLENLFQTGAGQGLRFPLRQLIPKLDEELTPGFKYMREVIDKKLDEMKDE